MSEFYAEQDNTRRQDLLNKVNVLREKFPAVNIVDNELSDDQLEIIYLRKCIELNSKM